MKRHTNVLSKVKCRAGDGWHQRAGNSSTHSHVRQKARAAIRADRRPEFDGIVGRRVPAIRASVSPYFLKFELPVPPVTVAFTSMPRKLRLQYPGAIYHLMNRGDQREDIFKDDEDRLGFLLALEEACLKTGWQVHAYCLMGNHFHLVAETPEANLVFGMKWLLGTYTKRFNIRHKLCGHLFAGRYKGLMVDGSGNGYLRTVCDYVHLNPVRARLIEPQAVLESYKWSSYVEYLKPAGQRRGSLRVDRLLGEHGIPLDSEAGRREFALQMERRRAEETGIDYRQLRKDWCLGSDEFRRQLLASAVERVGPNHYGADRREAAEERGKRIIAEEASRLGWKVSEFHLRSKSDPGKVAIARRLRRETTMSLKWVAENLSMGSWTSVANLVSTAVQTDPLQLTLKSED